MPTEIELKLRLPADAVEAFAAHPALAGVAPREKRLHNIYYDTPEQTLRQNGIALRFRQVGKDWLLTVKGTAGGAGGLAQRSEWETPARRGRFDFAHVDDERLRALLDAERPRLRPLFRTDFDRRIWLLPVADGGAIEVACDRGTIAAGRRREALCEVELERVGASDSAPLFALAITLAEGLPLHPEARSKAERGYALAAGTPAAPRKTAPTPVATTMTPLEAFQAIAFDSLDQLLRNEEGARLGQDPEYVHQARVGIRRLRSSFSLFSPVLPDGFVATWRAPWREVANALGGGRDWDVLIHETLPRFAADHADYRPPARLIAAARRSHAQALEATRAALAHPGYTRFLLLFAAAVHALHGPDAPRLPGVLPGFAAGRLEWQLRRAWRIVDGHGLKNPLHRHELRIALKKLRYALDFFAPLLPRRRLAAWRRQLTVLQEVLGRLNDIVVGRSLLASLQQRRTPDPLDNWLAAEHGRSIAGLSPALRRLRKRKRPWR